MKTIEEKAKAYDEAIERARKLKEDPQSVFNEYSPKEGDTISDYIFPELKESGDEKIRKEIIKWFEEFPDIIWRGHYKKDVIAWLEKQGELVEINPTEFDTRLQALIGKFGSLPKEELIGSLSFWTNVVQNDGTYTEEKQGEQKPTNKVEPKFKVGDWVKHNKTNFIFHISKITKDKYEFENSNGYNHSLPIKSMDEKYHLWAIQDAKDGDVLVHNNCTFIFMGIKDGIVQALEENLLDGKNPVPFGEADKDKDYHPATKEQRDTLFKAMTDAGYTFDFEKKELKETIDEKQIKKNLQDNSFRRMFEQKHAEWSEEDEHWRQKAIDFMKHPDLIKATPTLAKNTIDWLKSLKPYSQMLNKQNLL